MPGHIAQLGPDHWRLYVYAGTDPITGKGRQVTRVVRGPRRDADIELARLVVSVADGTAVRPENRTFGDVLDAFLEYKVHSLEPGTAAGYRHRVTYVPERLRALPVARIGPAELEALYAYLSTRGAKRPGSKGLHPASVAAISGVIWGALEMARRRRWISSNPSLEARPPRVPRRIPTPAPPEAIPALMEAAGALHESLPTYLRLAVITGARRSELHGLRWSSVDFVAGRLMLRDVVVSAGGSWVQKGRTKDGGYRLVDLDDETLTALLRHCDVARERAGMCGAVLPTDGFVFSDHPTGEVPWNPATTSRRFGRAAIHAGMPAGIRLHDLRALTATHLIDSGVPIPVVSARLGHSRNSITLDVYTGRVRASDRGAAEVMGRLFKTP